MTSLYAPGTDPEAGRPRRRGDKTPEHLLTPQAQGVPDDPVALPSSAWTSCAVCGEAAPTPTQTNGRARIDVWAQAPGGLMAHVVPVVSAYLLTRCDDCQAVNRRALAIMEANSGWATRLGPDLARERVEDVLVALGLLGQPLLGPEVTRLNLELHLRHLHPTGFSLAWRRRAVVGMCNPYPWAHARLSERRRLREAYAALLRERVALTAPPAKVPPPGLLGYTTSPAWGRGCLLCGLGHLVVPADQLQRLGGRDAASRALWRPALIDVSSLDGRPSPVRIDGHLCPACSDAVQEEGAVGPSSMSRTLFDAWAASGDPATRRKAEELRREVDLDLRPVGWGALAARDPGRVPNGEPWAHLTPV